MSEPRPTAFFRIVRESQAVRDDFVSSLQRCNQPRPAELEDPIEWAGVSVFDTRVAAQATANRFPRIGRYIAELRLPVGLPVVLRLIVLQTRGPGHYPLLGCAETLLAQVVDTRPVGK